MTLSFAKDIRPLFRDTPDVDSLKEYSLDLSICPAERDLGNTGHELYKSLQEV